MLYSLLCSYKAAESSISTSSLSLSLHILYDGAEFKPAVDFKVMLHILLRRLKCKRARQTISIGFFLKGNCEFACDSLYHALARSARAALRG
jgi:hypothetical protein